MFDKPFTFDRAFRLTLLLLLAFLLAWLFYSLSGVLLPFLLAVLVAYLMNPAVRFFQYRARLRSRTLCVTLVMLLFLGLLGLLFLLILPPFLDECVQLKEAVAAYLGREGGEGLLPAGLREEIERRMGQFDVEQFLSRGDAMQVVRETLPKLWQVFCGTAGFLMNIVSALIFLLYLFLILIDYDNLRAGWIHYVPRKMRPTLQALVQDVKRDMNGYFRGQALCALCVGALFTLGFFLIGFPMPFGLGALIGLLYMVPYMQLLGFIPATVLALLRASETGQNFWWLMLLVLLVYAAVQVIADLVLQPRIMGRMMRLSPAVIFLSLSVWAYFFGLVGLIIALPLTSTLSSFYRRYVNRDILTPSAKEEEAPVAEEGDCPDGEAGTE